MWTVWANQLLCPPWEGEIAVQIGLQSGFQIKCVLEDGGFQMKNVLETGAEYDFDANFQIVLFWKPEFSIS